MMNHQGLSERLALFDKGVPFPFLFKVVIGQVMEDALGSPHEVGVELTNRVKLCDSDYTNKFVFLFAFGGHAQLAMVGRARTVAPFTIYFAHSKCKLLLHDWTIVVPDAMLDGDEMMIVDRLTYLTGCLTKDDGLVLEMNTQISNAPVQ